MTRYLKVREDPLNQILVQREELTQCSILSQPFYARLDLQIQLEPSDKSTSPLLKTLSNLSSQFYYLEITLYELFQPTSPLYQLLSQLIKQQSLTVHSANRNLSSEDVVDLFSDNLILHLTGETYYSLGIVGTKVEGMEKYVCRLSCSKITSKQLNSLNRIEPIQVFLGVDEDSDKDLSLLTRYKYLLNPEINFIESEGINTNNLFQTQGADPKSLEEFVLEVLEFSGSLANQFVFEKDTFTYKTITWSGFLTQSWLKKVFTTFKDLITLEHYTSAYLMGSVVGYQDITIRVNQTNTLSKLPRTNLEGSQDLEFFLVNSKLSKTEGLTIKYLCN